MRSKNIDQAVKTIRQLIYDETGQEVKIESQLYQDLMAAVTAAVTTEAVAQLALAKDAIMLLEGHENCYGKGGEVVRRSDTLAAIEKNIDIIRRGD